MKKKYILFSSIFLVFSGLLITGWYWTEGYGFTKIDVTGETIEEAVFQYNYSMGEPFRYGQILEQVYIENDTSLVFLLDQTRTSINACIVSNKWNGKWKVVSPSINQVIQRHPALLNPYSWGGLETEKNTVYWGVIYDERVHTFLITTDKEEKADLLTLPAMPRIWYKVYPLLSEQIKKKITMKVLDEEGKEIPFENLN